MNNRETKLNTFFISEIGGDWGNEEKTTDTPIKVLCIRGADIDDVRLGRLSSAPTRYVKQASKKKILTNKDIVIEISGGSPTQSTGRTALVTDRVLKNISCPVVCSNFCRALRVKDEHYPSYVFYAMQNAYERGYFFNFEGKTTGIKNLDLKSSLNTIPIVVSPKHSQQKIADVLLSLDNKIELNNRINLELEAVAKTLYNYWFVQFDFPDANGKPYKSSGGKMVYSEVLKRDVPKDWSVKTLNEITPVATESVNPGNFPDKLFKHLSIPSFDAVGSFFEEKGETIGSNKFKVCSTDILVSKLNPKFSRVIYVTNEKDLICSTEFVVWRPENQRIKPFLYSIAKDPSFISFCQQSASGTSNSHKRINPKVMMGYQIAYNQDVCESFGKHIESSIKKMMINNLETKQLTSLRDWLLPMLMNGQVTVN